MTQNQPQNPSIIDPKTGLESNVVFWTIFIQFGAPQTLKNMKTPGENLCFSRVGLFRNDHAFDLENHQQWPKTWIQIRSTIDKKWFWNIFRCWSETWHQSDSQNGSQNRPTIGLGASLAQKNGPKSHNPEAKNKKSDPKTRILKRKTKNRTQKPESWSEKLKIGPKNLNP